MLRAVSYTLALTRWIVGHGLPGRRPPDYVVFVLDGEYTDYPWPAPNLFVRLLRRPSPNLLDLREHFLAIARDPRVRGVVLELRPTLHLRAAQVETLRDAMLELRGAGTRVVVSSFHYSRSSYHVATAADAVLIRPGGYVEALATSHTHLFLADALARIGVEADVLAISPFKTAMDALTHTRLSAEARAMSNWMLDAATQEFARSLAEARGIREPAAHDLIDQTPCTDERALELRLVDAIVAPERLPAWLAARAGHPQRRARLDAFDAARGTLRPRRPAFPAGRHVALIPIEGLIFDGESRRTPVPLPIPLPLVGEARSGDLTVVQAIRRAQRDARVGAVVVYVDSPGGSPFASEAMLGALIALNEHKPVVVAMGAVAASGGYYVAVPGRRVFAQPSTITGSIGVVSAKIVTRGLLDRFALRRETLHRGRHALLASPERAYTPEERALVWAHIGRTYDLFLDRVASGRGMTTAEVDAVGGGRVWTGRQALEHGLVDELGGLPAALAYARRLAGIRGDAPPLVIAGGGRQWLPPLVEAVPNGAGAVAYALDALAMLGSGAPLLISPLVRTDRR
ncbi:MAG: signal peptide peptidase SppA [Chloroflexi bacterium]|nr:signal peptide peptidase SppA [Chloroflexota bacterium]